jgi:hypothetical protein
MNKNRERQIPPKIHFDLFFISCPARNGCLLQFFILLTKQSLLILSGSLNRTITILDVVLKGRVIKTTLQEVTLSFVKTCPH